jgi:DNA-binding NarL/FixJ family response regulator
MSDSSLDSDPTSNSISFALRSFAEPVRVAIADGNQMNGELLTAALKRNRAFEVTGTVTDSDSVRSEARKGELDVLVIGPDLSDGVGSGFKLIRELRADQSRVNVVALLDSSQRDRVVEAFWCGATGVFFRSGSIKELCKCILCVHAGQVWASSQELRVVLDALSYSLPPRLVSSTGVDLLTRREQDVVRCLAEGLSNREVAERLKISEHTVKNYLLHIFDKLGVSSRVEVVLYAACQRAPFETPASM